MTDAGWFDHDRRVLGLYLSGADLAVGPDGAPATSLLVLLNTGPDEAPFVLPAAPWATAYRGLLDTVDEQPRPSEVEESAGTTALLAPFSVRVLAAVA
jgi:hypothetical protein